MQIYRDWRAVPAAARGATVTATAEIIALDPATKRVTLKTTCTVAGKVVIEGEAEVIAPSPRTLDV